MDSNPICQPSPAKKWNATFWITFNFWWLAGLVNGLKPHPPPLSSQRKERLIFLLCSTSNDQPGLSMDLNPIHNLSPAKKWNAHILIMFNFWWLPGLVNGLKPHPPPLSSQKKMKCLFLDYIHFWWSAWLIDELEPHLPPLSSQKNEMLLFGLCSTSDDQPGWLMDSNAIHHPSLPKKMKSSFLYYIKLLMISRAGWWTRTPSASPLQPKKWNAHFCITINFWFMPDWSMDSNPIHHPSPTNKMKCSFLDYAQLLMIGRVGWWTQTPSTTPLYPKKWNAHFWIMFNFWWLAELLDWLEPHPPPLSSQKHEMLVFV